MLIRMAWLVGKQEDWQTGRQGGWKASKQFPRGLQINLEDVAWKPLGFPWGNRRPTIGIWKTTVWGEAFKPIQRGPLQKLRDNITFWCCMVTTGISLMESEAHYGNMKNKCLAWSTIREVCHKIPRYRVWQCHKPQTHHAIFGPHACISLSGNS